jgi:uncharacterized protein YgiB involved in biofilm formation
LKRSEYIAIGAVGLLAVATLWPSNQHNLPPADPALNAAKGDGFQTLAFASLAECKDSQAVTASTCETEYAKASETSTADAPKFEALADCEAEYGASQCRPASWNGASVFIPAMAGVLIARSLAGAATSQPLYPPRTGPQSCPTGVSLADRPECAQRSSSSSSSSSSGSGGSSSSSSSGRRYYSTGTGNTISRVGSSVIADVVLPSRTTVSRSTPSRSSTSGWSGSSSSSSSSYSRSSTTGVSSSSSTSSRGGFGSTASSSSSWGG